MTNGDTHDAGYVAAAASRLSLSGVALREFLAAVLERGAPFRFTARGHSMYPFIRDADVITVSPLSGRAPRTGDVVAYRDGEDRLVVHRIVAVTDGRYELRGDNCPVNDGLVPPEAVLGVVTRVECAGRVRRLGIGHEAALLARLSRAGALRPLRVGVQLPRRAAALALAQAQRASACRRVLRRLRPAFDVQSAMQSDETELARRFGLRADLGTRRDGMEVNAFVARAGGHQGRIIGFVELVRRGVAEAPYDGFWIHATTVAARFRGMGVAEALMQRTIGAAWDAGADDVRLSVYADNTPALALYRKLGFVPFVLPALAKVFRAEECRDGRRQISLRLALPDRLSASPSRPARRMVARPDGG